VGHAVARAPEHQWHARSSSAATHHMPNSTGASPGVGGPGPPRSPASLTKSLQAADRVSLRGPQCTRTPSMKRAWVFQCGMVPCGARVHAQGKPLTERVRFPIMIRFSHTGKSTACGQRKKLGSAANLLSLSIRRMMWVGARLQFVLCPPHASVLTPDVDQMKICTLKSTSQPHEHVSLTILLKHSCCNPS
jgi:hypothetical protein